MSDRWRLERAGIINVFQYGEETLHFGGGRLLLRGVNGSGKSTAMNMLLPFLLDADVRRIDAAGEQSGMLRSWMLSGRDEPQPTGYLWLEMTRDEDHVAFGCGIKANRNTDSVKHWWFVTDRRPGIDLDLVQPIAGGGRAPLSAEQLRTEIGGDSVWTEDRRAAYRGVLRGRLYGGADLDQHPRLLHVVRNPRVGDRIDVDLPKHLHDALPQLSDAAIDDAATPLEQLEEHRRNVAQLTATVRTLDALVATYRQHARSELRSRAQQAVDRVGDHRRLETRVHEAVAAHRSAQSESDAIDAAITRWSDAVEVHRRELDALRKSPAYQSVTQLDDKRAQVRQLESAAEEAEADHAQACEHLQHATADVTTAARSTDAAGTRFDESLAMLELTVADARLSMTLPARPTPAVGPLTISDVDRGGFDEVVAAPTGLRDHTDATVTLRSIRAAAQRRSGEVAEAIGLSDLAERAAEALAGAEEKLADAEARHADALRHDEDARSAVRSQAERWRAAAGEWDRALADHITSISHLASLQVPRPVTEADVAELHEELLAARRASIDAVRSAHTRLIASLDARLDVERIAAAEAQALVAQLAARELPDSPLAAWQAERSSPSLAELVDFADDLPPVERAGLEAALEASGILAAEVRPDGLVSGDGELLVGVGPRVDRSLADLLAVVVPEDADHPDTVREVVAGVLAAVSIDPDDIAPDVGPDVGPAAVVTLDGHFRLGPLRGRHTKTVAEHIGITARRDALARQREHAAATAAEADAAVAATDAERHRAVGWNDEADRLATELPSTTSLVEAIAGMRHAEMAVAVTAEAEQQAADAVATAERAHAQRLDAARRRCAELDLPHDSDALQSAAEACRLVPSHADNLAVALESLVRETAGWLDAGRRWREAANQQNRTEDRQRRRRQQHTEALAELATLEDQIGVDAAEVLAAIEEAERAARAADGELRSVRDRQGPAKERVGVASSEAQQAAAELNRSETACMTLLHHLHAVVAVDGLLPAALGDDTGTDADTHADAATHADADAATEESGSDTDESDIDGSGRTAQHVDPSLRRLPTVDSTSAGLRRYATAVLDLVPDAPPTPADSVRIALRSRRPDLGAGWDAQDLQPDPSLPLSVEVVGPLGTMPLARAAVHANTELRTASGLLSSQQDTALRNLLQGLIADEVAEKMHAATELVDRMNDRLRSVRTTHGVGVSLRWRRRDDLPDETGQLIDLLATRSDLRQDPTAETRLVDALSRRIDDARQAEPESPYATLIAKIFDYREWHTLAVMVHRTGRDPERLKRGTALSEGEKKMVSYQPLFAAVAASCDALAETASHAPRFVLLDDAFAKVSEDNHPKLFGLLVDLDLDFIATSERLWGTHATVPELAITEVVRDADAGVIVLEHSYWNGRVRTEVS